MQTIVRSSSVGAISSQAKISVTDVAAVYTPPAGTKGVKFQNQGTKIVWYGGSDVSPANNIGNMSVPRTVDVWESINNDFSVYFVCATGETSTIGVITW